MPRLAAAVLRLARMATLAVAALAFPAWAQDLPVVLGERVTGVAAKMAASPFLLTTEDEMPARALRLTRPGEGEFRALDRKPGTAAKRVELGFGRGAAEFAEEPGAGAIVWQKVGQYRIAKFRVVSPGAKAMRVGIRIGASRQPWELRVAGSADETKALGPVRLGGPLGKAGIHWTPVTEGEAQVIEIASPAAQPDPAIEVETVSHLVASPGTLFRKTTANIGDSLSCNIDIKCVTNPTQAFLDAADATVHLLFTRRSGGTAMCSGTMLNDTTPGTQIPYLYTANHCFEADSAPYNTAAQMQQVANSLNTFFFFDAVACNSFATPAYVQLVGGATYLHHSLSQDVLFLRLNDWAPMGAYLLGWDANPITAVNTPIVVLHHPLGDLKMYTAGVVDGLDILTSPRSASTGYWRTSYNQGVTEFGSSGGGLLTLSSGQYVLRGSLSTGNIFQCTARQPDGYYIGNDWFTRFDAAFPNLRPWLQATNLPQFDVTDLWWNPAENGWGINLTQKPNGTLVALWYTYAADTGPLWFIMSGGTWTTSRTFTGTLYRASGQPYSPLPFNPGSVNYTPVGSLTFNFTDANNGSFTWVVDGVQNIEIIERNEFN